MKNIIWRLDPATPKAEDDRDPAMDDHTWPPMAMDGPWAFDVAAPIQVHITAALQKN